MSLGRVTFKSAVSGCLVYLFVQMFVTAKFYFKTNGLSFILNLNSAHVFRLFIYLSLFLFSF